MAHSRGSHPECPGKMIEIDTFKSAKFYRGGGGGGGGGGGAELCFFLQSKGAVNPERLGTTGLESRVTNYTCCLYLVSNKYFLSSDDKIRRYYILFQTTDPYHNNLKQGYVFSRVQISFCVRISPFENLCEIFHSL